MTYKVVRVGVPLPEELAEPERRKLRDVGAELTMHPYSGEDELIAAVRDADAVINAGGRFPKRVIDAMDKAKLLVRPERRFAGRRIRVGRKGMVDNHQARHFTWVLGCVQPRDTPADGKPRQDEWALEFGGM